MSSPPPPATSRHLAAVWFADVVDYSPLASRDEAAALLLISQFQLLCRHFVQQHDGRLIKFVGDGALAEFSSTEAAARSALELVAAFAAASGYTLRTGIHVGDIMGSPDGDVYGDGVNTAARLQQIATPGQVLVSEDVWRQLRPNAAFELRGLGQRRLKGSSAPLSVFNLGAVDGREDRPRRSVLGRLTLARSLSKRGTRVLLGFAVIPAVLGLALILNEIRQQDHGSMLDRSLAVLPFESLSADPQNEYLAGAIQDEVITQLTRVPDLRVISRQSVRGYAGTTKSVQEIGEELAVGRVLQGTVQRVEGRVRVNAQLVDVESGTHLWAERFDHAASEALILQSEIALAIVTEVRARLSASVPRELEESLTQNTEASNLYRKGREYQQRSHGEEDVRAAMSLYQRAVELDPRFALARARLGLMHAEMYWHGYDRSVERIEEAHREAERALRTHPGLPEGHVALGFYWFFRNREYARSQAEFETALRDLPNDPEVSAALGVTTGRQGHWEEGAAWLRRALKLDPRSFFVASQLPLVYRALRQYADEVQAWDYVVQLAPQNHDAAIARGYTFLAWVGTTDSIAAALQRIPSDKALISRARFAQLTRRLNDVITLTEDTLPTLVDQATLPAAEIRMMRGNAYAGLGDPEGAEAEFQAARLVLEGMVKEDSSDAHARADLAVAYAALGQKEAAAREAAHAMELRPLSKDAFEAPLLYDHAAATYARIGEADLAIDLLEQLLVMPLGLSVHQLRVEPRWDPLRGHSRFQQLLAPAP